MEKHRAKLQEKIAVLLEQVDEVIVQDNAAERNDAVEPPFHADGYYR